MCQVLKSSTLLVATGSWWYETHVNVLHRSLVPYVFTVAFATELSEWKQDTSKHSKRSCNMVHYCVILMDPGRLWHKLRQPVGMHPPCAGSGGDGGWSNSLPAPAGGCSEWGLCSGCYLLPNPSPKLPRVRTHRWIWGRAARTGWQAPPQQKEPEGSQVSCLTAW